jgi:hypothetical protein
MKVGINMKNKAFKTMVERGFNDGFQMTFENGCTISIQFGKHTYSDQGQTTAEVAAWDNKGTWFMFYDEKWNEIPEGSDTMNYTSAGEVAKLIYTLSQW